LQSYANGSMPGAFGKPGWLREVFGWINQQIAPFGRRTTGPFRQLNASPTFSLLRIETNGPPLWFKAVGQPNLREYPITCALSKHFPAFVPHVIATHKEWNAWLAAEGSGAHPDENSDFQAWLTITMTLADLQLASFGQGLHLIDAGCRDVRVCALVDLVKPFLESMAALMEQQRKVSPAPLSYQELMELAGPLREALAILEDSGIPNALGHLDFNPGNILVSLNRCVFLDWAEACVGHPFLTFEYLLENLRRLRPFDQSWQTKLLSAYMDQWRFFVEPEALVEAIATTPLLAVFVYALSGESWRDPARLRDSSAASHLRSLVRRMKREAQTLAARRVSCVS
jgi:hypothetical protein